MSKEKMISKPPAPDAPGRSPLERTEDLMRRLVAMPREKITPKRKPKRKHR